MKIPERLKGIPIPPAPRRITATGKEIPPPTELSESQVMLMERILSSTKGGSKL